MGDKTGKAFNFDARRLSMVLSSRDGRSMLSEFGQGTRELGENFPALPRFQYMRELLPTGLVHVSSTTRRHITRVFYFLRRRSIDDMTSVLTNG